MWEGSAGARLRSANTDESKTYWLLMVLVSLLKWVCIFV